MAGRPSEPILAWLRETLKTRNMNVAALADQVGEKRAVVRRVLAGREPLTVDQLVGWTQALNVRMEDLVGVPVEGDEAVDELAQTDAPPLRTIGQAEDSEEEAGDPYTIDPYGVQAEQAIRLGFALGVDFGFIADTAQLEESGVPESARQRFPKQMLIKLDAAYHRYNEPVYDEDGLRLTLSFDTIRYCSFPWSSILQVTWYVEPPPPATQPEPEPEPPDDGGRPVLRLVKS